MRQQTLKEMSASNKIRHFFHVVSNIRPIIWIGAYVLLMPIFAFIYWGLPDSQFRIPDGAGTDYWSWLYYSIVTITTLGFGDYTPAHAWAQAVTAVEVMCGLVILGFFLNAVGSMKSEIDVESEIEKQKQAHFSLEKEKLMLCIPTIIHSLNTFLAYCYAVTTPLAKRNDEDVKYNPDFTFNDMADLFKPSGLPFDNTRLPAVARLVKCAAHTSLNLDSIQNRLDLTLWPDVLEDCFAFVANYQMFSSTDSLSGQASSILSAADATTDETAAEQKISAEISASKATPDISKAGDLQPVVELYFFIKENANRAIQLEKTLSQLANS